MRSMWHLTENRYRSCHLRTREQHVDQNTRQQMEQPFTAYHDTWNKQDAAGIASLYTPDGVLVTSDVKPVSNGTQEIIEHSTKISSNEESPIMTRRQSTK